MNEQWVIESAYLKAYATARAQRCYGARRPGETLRRLRAFGLLIAGLVSCGMFALDHFRLLRARLMLARARGALAAYTNSKHRAKETA